MEPQQSEYQWNHPNQQDPFSAITKPWRLEKDPCDLLPKGWDRNGSYAPVSRQS